ncbi:ABC transporter permease [Carnobacterium divergens]|uniref:ABC transporter, permease protein n=1 Tax=Carnobacterium divergens DSM 20623 TaxID=1449336 RepID=A0A0R2HXN8_CARDV|nr:ABC transporter permease [Carnobacterium divergens]KRN57352.1 ABC transporter, permease protein [Carnobacterium divergens DSM 20623]MDO0875324.1 ABC transporter permease [Carnobacterium divergens]SUX17197.1 ATPase involved in DNA repair [Carnobacterium divergens]
MKKTALLKDIFREIWHTKARFLSIFAIITLGVGFFSGIKATGPNMIDTADHYFKEKNLMDVKVVSTYGLNNEDLTLLKSIKGAEVAGGYSQDVFLGNTGIVTKVMSLPEKTTMNDYRVMKGRLPVKKGEIALDYTEKMQQTFKIGDKVSLTSEGDKTNLNSVFKTVDYQVVGFVNSPQYIETFQRGSSTIGKGTADAFAVIPESDFKSDLYTEAYLTFDTTKKLAAYSKEYEDQIDNEIKAVEKKINQRPEERLAELKQTGAEKITDGTTKITEAKQQLADGQKQLDEAKAKLVSGESDYQTGLETFQSEIAKGEATLTENQAKLTSSQAELEANETQLNEGKKQLAAAQQELATKKATAIESINQGQNLVTSIRDSLKVPIALVPEATKTTLITSSTQVDKQLGELIAAYFAGAVSAQEVTFSLDTIEVKLSASQTELDQAESALNQKATELANGETALLNGKTQLDAGRRALSEGQQKLASEKATGEKKLAEVRNQLDEGNKEYESAKAEFDQKKQQGEAEIAKGEQELAEAKEQLTTLKKPEYFVMDRTSNPGYEEFSDNANRISAIAQVFPVFFFLIAALVSLTTMTRMVEEQRLQIGTLKALGYTSFDISKKFLIYALLASGSASLIGLFIGYQLFPTIIFNAYGALYNLPAIRITYYLSYGILSLVVALFCTVLPALIATRVELMSNPAALMRPKAPKNGKRILLERITFLWDRFNFIEKVTARNLFRYKQRMLMTVLGVAGCTALILTGFGLKDSIADIAGLQYGKIMKYQAIVAFNPDAKQADKEKYNQLITDTKEIKHQLAVNQENFKMEKQGVNTQEVTLFTPEKTTNFDQFVLLNNRKTKAKEEISKQGGVITEKLAKLFDLKVGDKLSIKDTNNKTYSLKVTGITENYAGHMIYISPTYYQKLFKKEPPYNTQLLNYKANQKWEDQFGTRLTENGSVARVTFVDRVGSSFKDTMSSLNIVTLVLIISAAALAFIVLYNLTNINVSERIRELSTIKVLGFYDGEVTMYIYRENIILTMMGIVTGSFLGIFLHGFVLQTAEVDMMMFSPTIKVLSYVYSAALTFLFSGIVMWAMHLKLKQIDMIEALKSVD